MRWLLAALGVVFVAACSRPQNTLLPVTEPVQVGDTVDMLTATTRAPSDEPGVVFTGERGDSLAFTNIVVSLPPGREVGSVQWPRQGPGDPSREFAVTSLSAVPRDGVLPWFKTHTHGKRRVLVFVHGFNTPFDAAVFRFAQFIHDSNVKWAPVLFTWPSRGRLLDYVYDRESANFSRTDLAYVLSEAARSPQVEEVVILAHSMGAWLAVESLRQLALQNGRIPAKITNVILASPDLDIDVFRRQLVEMGPKRPNITIFVARNDRALSVSRIISGNITRVGAADPHDANYSALLAQTPGITVVDLSALEGGDALNHTLFATTPETVQLIGTQLMGQTLDDGQVTGADAAQAAGATVGAIAAAPITIITGGMRH